MTTTSDSALSLAVLSKLEGHEVHTAGDGEEADNCCALLAAQHLNGHWNAGVDVFVASRQIRSQPGADKIVI